MDKLIKTANKYHGFLEGVFSTEKNFKFDKRWNSHDNQHECKVSIEGVSITSDAFNERTHSFDVSFMSKGMKKIEKIVFNSYDLRKLFFYCGDHCALKANFEKNKKFVYCLNLKWITENFGTFTVTTKKASFEYFEALAKSAQEFDIALTDIFKESDFGISEFARNKLTIEFGTIATLVSKLFVHGGSSHSFHYKEAKKEKWEWLNDKISDNDHQMIYQIVKSFLPEFGPQVYISKEVAYSMLKTESLKEI